MSCDYCGLATDEPARWEVSSGRFPGDGMTRYVCEVHRGSAEQHVAQLGDVFVFPMNSDSNRRAAA
ncbi:MULTISPECIES: hypothetical protein [unclassified Micromonospora]|uniref:hypothetical protein n=1 Tax=unclassified Micromonospora TaxID=2617518 RepID=UPI0033CE9AF5